MPHFIDFWQTLLEVWEPSVRDHVPRSHWRLIPVHCWPFWGPCRIGWCLLRLSLWSLLTAAVLAQGLLILTQASYPWVRGASLGDWIRWASG